MFQEFHSFFNEQEQAALAAKFPTGQNFVYTSTIEPGIYTGRVEFSGVRFTNFTIETDWDMETTVEDNGPHFC